VERGLAGLFEERDEGWIGRVGFRVGHEI
jgi:hypothetical protein